MTHVPVFGAKHVELAVSPAGLGLVPSGTDGGGGRRLPVGWVLLGPDHRPPGDSDDGAELRRIPDGTAVQLDEVLQ